jgi:hypothetical protein
MHTYTHGTIHGFVSCAKQRSPAFFLLFLDANSACMYACMYVCMCNSEALLSSSCSLTPILHVCMHACMYVCVIAKPCFLLPVPLRQSCMYVCMHACMYICSPFTPMLYVCLYVCMYVFITVSFYA